MKYFGMLMVLLMVIVASSADAGIVAAEDGLECVEMRVHRYNNNHYPLGGGSVVDPSECDAVYELRAYRGHQHYVSGYPDSTQPHYEFISRVNSRVQFNPNVLTHTLVYLSNPDYAFTGWSAPTNSRFANANFPLAYQLSGGRIMLVNAYAGTAQIWNLDVSNPDHYVMTHMISEHTFNSAYGGYELISGTSIYVWTYRSVNNDDYIVSTQVIETAPIWPAD